MINLPQNKERNKMIFVKEPYEFIKGKYKLNLLALKILALIFTKINPDDEKFKEYEISVKEIQRKIGKNYGNSYKYIKDTILDLMKITLQLEDEKEWRAFNILVEPTLKKGDGKIKFWISPSILELLKKSKHYLKYNVEVLVYFNSSYALRLYKILRDRFEINKKFNNFSSYEIGLDTLIDLLQVPYKRYSNIKQKVINKAIAEINKYSDIQVTYEEVKKGRKVESIIFYIEENKKHTTKEPKKIEKPKKANKEEQKKENDALKAFRKEIIAKYNNSDKYFMIDDKTFKIKEELLFVDDEALKASEAIKWWKYIYKNKDKIKEVDPIEEEKRAKELFYKELNDRYVGEEVEIPISGGELIKAKILKILPGQSEELKVMFKGENGKFYAQEMSLNSLKNLSI